MKSIRYFILILFSSVCLTFAQEPAFIVQQKVMLEKSLEDKLFTLVSKMLNNKNVVVIVNAELATKKEKGKVPTVSFRKKEETGSSLPGVPLKKKIGEPEMINLLPISRILSQGYKTGTVEVIIRKLNIALIVDRNIPQEKIDRVFKIVKNLIGIDPSRGDSLIIQKEEFTQKQSKILEIVNQRPIYFGILFILFLLSIFIVVIIFLRGLNKIFQSKPPKETLAFMRNPNAQPTPQPPAVPQPQLQTVNTFANKEQEKKERAHRPFGFINDSNLKYLMYILNEENPETISFIVSYLPVDYTTQILSSLPKEKREKVILNLTHIKEVNPIKVKDKEEEIKKRINFILGGLDYVISTLEESDKNTREELLGILKEYNPEVAYKVQREIIKFEDIADFSKETVQRIFGEVGLSTFAIALNAVDSETRNRIISKLTAGAAVMVNQEVEFGKQTSSEEKNEAQKKILNIIRRLKEQNLLRKESEGSATVEVNHMEEEKTVEEPITVNENIKRKQPLKLVVYVASVAGIIGIAIFIYLNFLK